MHYCCEIHLVFFSWNHYIFRSTIHKVCTHFRVGKVENPCNKQSCKKHTSSAKSQNSNKKALLPPIRTDITKTVKKEEAGICFSSSSPLTSTTLNFQIYGSIIYLFEILLTVHFCVYCFYTYKISYCYLMLSKFSSNVHR